MIAFRSIVLSAIRGFRDNEVLLQAVRKRFTQFFIVDSERAIMTDWQRSIVTFYLRYMVSEETWFYCKPDMTSL